MKSQYLKKLKLPAAPGVYIFKDRLKRPIYIGRATSLADRVKSYFSIDLIVTRGPRIVDMVTRSTSLDWEETDSVLEAILLESRLIKRYQPRYNVDERDDKSSLYVVITNEPWPRVFTVRARDLEKRDTEKSRDNDLVLKELKGVKILKRFGPYPNSGLINESLKILRKMFPFRDKKANDPRHEAFYRAIGRSPASTSVGLSKTTDETNFSTGESLSKDVEAQINYRNTIKKLALFFEGKKKRLRSMIEKEMHDLAKEMRFEEAGKAKRMLYAIDHVNDIALIKKDTESIDEQIRIEAYDVAHTAGKEVVGVMVVSHNGERVPAEYRMFKIDKDENNDIKALMEILSRRLNHSEWSYPDLIVVDGGEAQLNAARGALAIRRLAIPVVAVTKDERHKASQIIGDESFRNKYAPAIIATNAESHRFAISYHRRRRGKAFGV